jgi:hypothetical protein
VYRFVGVSSREIEGLWKYFKSDREDGKPPKEREQLYDELRDGMSAYVSWEAARDVWQGIEDAQAARKRSGRRKPLRIGDYIAEVQLVKDQGFEIEDIGDVGGHLTIFGDPRALAAAVTDIQRGAKVG